MPLTPTRTIMTPRQRNIAKAILEALHDRDGGQLDEISIHADACLLIHEMIPRNEFDEAFETLTRDGCFIGVKLKYNLMMWSLTSRGEQIRQEMK